MVRKVFFAGVLACAVAISIAMPRPFPLAPNEPVSVERDLEVVPAVALLPARSAERAVVAAYHRPFDGWIPPLENSSPPTEAEWTSSESIEGLGCAVHRKREWLRFDCDLVSVNWGTSVSCRGDCDEMTPAIEAKPIPPGGYGPSQTVHVTLPIRRDARLLVEVIAIRQGAHGVREEFPARLLALSQEWIDGRPAIVVM